MKESKEALLITTAKEYEKHKEKYEEAQKRYLDALKRNEEMLEELKKEYEKEQALKNLYAEMVTEYLLENEEEL